MRDTQGVRGGVQDGVNSASSSSYLPLRFPDAPQNEGLDRRAEHTDLSEPAAERKGLWEVAELQRESVSPNVSCTASLNFPGFMCSC